MRTRFSFGQHAFRYSLAFLSAAMLLNVHAPVHAGDVEIVHARLSAGTGADWRADVTLRHADSGWEHYADAWRVVAEDGAVLGTRTLFHPHETEQPFTRSLSGITIPSGANVVFVEAHDKEYGWSEQRVRVELSKTKGERFEVRR